ncbi:hypothetical protein CRYUN_Cryun39dG0005600 [Craigia yunnanensis]
MSFPNLVEDSVSMADKFKICSDISLAFKNLGYVGDMNYYKGSKERQSGDRLIGCSLTNMHESFEQITEKILATDRIQREMAAREKKLDAMASRSLNVDKPQVDLDAIVKENEYLEQQLRES